jgi:hypothetical protein
VRLLSVPVFVVPYVVVIPVHRIEIVRLSVVTRVEPDITHRPSVILLFALRIDVST